ncbi:MAG: hypothetical protein ABJZ55_26180 [Fuerstiella sp.]
MEKVKYVCPICTRSFRVPAKFGNAPCCGNCKQAWKARQEAEQLANEEAEDAARRAAEAASLAQQQLDQAAHQAAFEYKKQKAIQVAESEATWMKATAAWCPDPSPLKQVPEPNETYPKMKTYAGVCSTLGYIHYLLAVLATFIGGILVSKENTAIGIPFLASVFPLCLSGFTLNMSAEITHASRNSAINLERIAKSQ